MRYNDTKNKRRRHILKRKNIEKDEKLINRLPDTKNIIERSHSYKMCII